MFGHTTCRRLVFGQLILVDAISGQKWPLARCVRASGQVQTHVKSLESSKSQHYSGFSIPNVDPDIGVGRALKCGHIVCQGTPWGSQIMGKAWVGRKKKNASGQPSAKNTHPFKRQNSFKMTKFIIFFIKSLQWLKLGRWLARCVFFGQPKLFP